MKRSKFSEQQIAFILRCCQTKLKSLCLARWGEIDFDAKAWTIPAERMKGRKRKKRSHVAPLSPRALEILKALPVEGGSSDGHGRSGRAGQRR